VNKKDAIRLMARDAGITYQQAEKAFSSLFQGVRKALIAGKRVTFSGFGAFETAQRKARMGRNPKTGDSIQIPRKRRIRFIASGLFKAQL
jgi:DNA-binding protein HU-beta